MSLSEKECVTKQKNHSINSSMAILIIHLNYKQCPLINLITHSKKFFVFKVKVALIILPT
ncbi:hypothetical protein HanRHA438_Chr07g0310341 [Helianthus annuus]|nr:hypothetical protein HanRHA438_Chr07g0310341 [Helianthus annuus]